jgi:predicted  nucleic acid-binding Zn-ribbon protein
MTAGLEKEVNSLKSRIKELEENLEIAIDERNGLSDSVIDKCNTISRLRESVRYWSKVVDKLRKRAGKEGGWG